MGIKSRISNAILASVKKSDWYMNEIFQDCTKFWNLSKFNLDVINLGSTSAVHSFNYDGLPLKCENFALSRNYLAGDRAILQNYVSHLNPNGATVIIPLCVFSSLSSRYDFFDDRYYTILYPSSIQGFSKMRQNAVMDLRANPIRHYPAFQMWLSFRRKTMSLLPKRPKGALSEAEMERSACMWISDWMHEFGLDDLSSPLSMVNKDAVDNAVYLLNEIIAYCRELGHKPILVFPPMYHTLSEKFSNEARDILIGTMLDGLKENTVPFLDYMDDNEFCRAPELFENAYIMNDIGAKKFTRRVFVDAGLI